MDSNSRTFKSLRNSFISLGIFAVNLVLQFISRKVFLDYLGSEVLGLNSTASDLLQFLNIAELGVGVSISYALYKPLAENDGNTINEIISVQGWLYRRIALVIGVGAVAMMAFFPFIFNKIELPLWYAYASFGVLLFGSLITYLANYRETLLVASQQEYKVQGSYRVVILLKIVAQIICIRRFENGYIWWLALEFIFAILASIALNIAVNRSFPDLKADISLGRKLKEKHAVIITKVKQFFFHKVAGFAMTRTSGIILYGYTTLTMVAIYGNYMLIVNGITSLLNAIFNGLMASVGNLVSESKEDHIMDVFRELFTSRFLIVSTLTFGIYMLSGPFIVHWVGAEYKLPKLTLALISLIFYLTTQRSVVDSFINAYGLFKDIWAPMVEAGLNIGLSVLLGYFFGLDGILTGVIISLLLIVNVWKPYFLFSNKFSTSIMWYIRLYAKLLLIFAVCFLLTSALLNVLNINPEADIKTFVIYAVISVGVFCLSLFLLLYVFESSMRMFTRRFIKH